jgi:hypothetical protein
MPTLYQPLPPSVLCVTLLVGLLAMFPARATDADSPTATQILYERHRSAVLEVTVESRANQGRVSAASGFVTHRSEWVVTNYHAIARTLFEPEGHRLQVHTSDGEAHEVAVLAVDVVNDLAILQVDRPLDAPHLTLREDPPVKGETGYSMGKPGNAQHSIVGGTFNGTGDRDTIPVIIFSGAINAGMSGGPLLDGQGRVVGVNVASSARHQMVGFGVPAAALGKLIRAQNGQPPPSHKALRADIARQVSEYGRQVLARLDLPQHKVRQLGPFSVQGDLATDQPCRTRTDSKPQDRFTRLLQQCSVGDGLFVMRGQSAGRIITGTLWTHSDQLSPAGLAKLVERQLGDLREVAQEGSPPGRWDCTEQRLRVASDLPVQLYACRRPTQHLPEVFDYRFRYVPLTRGQDTLVGAVALSGFVDDTAQRVLTRILETLRFSPEGRP